MRIDKQFRTHSFAGLSYKQAPELSIQVGSVLHNI